MIQRLLSLAFAVLCVSLAGPVRAELAGIYNGIEAADGMRLEFNGEDDALEGIFLDRSGERRPFSGLRSENGGEAVIDRDGQRLYALFVEEALGLTLIVVPSTETGELATGRTEAFVFIKDGVAPPPKPARYVPPPTNPSGVIAPQAFVESYPFWPSANVGYGYEMLRGRNRTLIRLHPLVMTDILWKMCRSQSSPTGLAEALRGQGTNCQEILATFARIMGPGGGVRLYNRYREDVEAERRELVEAIRCSVDYRRNEPECLAAGKSVAKRAVSLETVKTVIGRY